MDRTDVSGTATRDLVCESCGRLPHPSRRRSRLANLAVVFPIDLLLLALVIGEGLPFIATVALLAITTTIPAICVVEPSFMRPLRWLHSPELRIHRHLCEAAALWRARATVRETPGALNKLSNQLAPLGAEILSLQAHPNFRGVRNELAVSTREQVHACDLFAAAHAAGSIHAQAWPITPLALVDSSTEALHLATSVSDNPRERLSEIREVAELGNRPGLSEAAFQPGTGPRSSWH
jgi:hypothetical protein